VPYTLKLTVPASATAGSISNTINFTAGRNFVVAEDRRC
jgi:hypothetical protein